MNENTRRSAKPKSIGDVTSVTIPKEYVDFITREVKEVTPELLDKVNTALASRELVHLIFTGIAVVHSLDDAKDCFEELQHSMNAILKWKKRVLEPKTV